MLRSVQLDSAGRSPLVTRFAGSLSAFRRYWLSAGHALRMFMRHSRRHASEWSIRLTSTSQEGQTSPQSGRGKAPLEGVWLSAHGSCVRILRGDSHRGIDVILRHRPLHARSHFSDSPGRRGSPLLREPGDVATHGDTDQVEAAGLGAAGTEVLGEVIYLPWRR